MTLPVVFVPGHMCDARVFGPQIEGLSSRLPVHVSWVAGDDSICGMAETALGAAPPRFWIVGLSMGGIVAMEIVRQAPERIAGVAFLDTNHRAESGHVARDREMRMSRAAKGKLEAVIRDEMKPRYLADGPHRTEVLRTVMSMAMEIGTDVFLRQSTALLGRPDQTETLRSIEAPCLVMCGEEDQLCPPRIHAEMAAIVPGARLEIVSGAGHLPTLEQPEATNARLANWIELE